MTNTPALPYLARRELLLGTAATFALAGCADLKNIVGPPPPPQLYQLRPAMPAAGGQPVRWQLTITTPDAPASLDTNRIALSPTPSKMDYFANAAWPDNAPVILQSLLVEAFDRTGRVSVARDTSGIATNYVLQTELRDFQANYDTAPVAGQPGSPPHVVVQIEAKLLAIIDRRIVGSVNVVQRADAQGNAIDSIVAAFGQATGAALAQIVDWTLRTPPAA
jgi:cholesterol transport system auxiliary component